MCNRDTVSDLAERLASDLEVGAEIPLHRALSLAALPCLPFSIYQESVTMGSVVQIPNPIFYQLPKRGADAKLPACRSLFAGTASP